MTASTSTSTESLIRVTVCVNRRSGTTEDAFNKYWAYKHGPLATEWLQKNGIIKYVQYHTTSEYKSLGQKMFDATGRSPLSYDGMADFYVKKYEDFEAAFLDPYYLEVIQPDEKILIDMDTIAVTIGVDYIVIADNKTVTEHESEF